MAKVVEITNRFRELKLKMILPAIIVVVVVLIILDGLVHVPAGHVGVIFDMVILEVFGGL